jgi:hypothetical protein
VTFPSSISSIWRTRSRTWARAKSANWPIVWRFWQPEKRSASWRRTIDHQRERIALLIKGTPSLKAVLGEKDWRQDMWLDAIAQASKETGIDEGAFPGASPWDLNEALGADFWPDS